MPEAGGQFDVLIPALNRGLDALEEGDVETFIAAVAPHTHPDCEFSSGIGSAVGGGTYRGVDGVREWFTDFVTTSQERHWRNRRFEILGDSLMLFLADLDMTGATSGVPVTTETGVVFEIEDGLCFRMNSFTSQVEAREFAEARVA